MSALPQRITYDFRPETKRQRRNRERLAAIIALGKPAIEAPKGCFNLADAGIKPSKPKKEIFDMTQQPQYANGTATKAAEETAAALEPARRSKPGPKAAKLSDLGIREIHAHYLEIGNLKETAQLHGISQNTLRQRFNKLGLPVLARGGNRKDKKTPAAKSVAADNRLSYTPPSVEKLPPTTAKEIIAELTASEPEQPTAVPLPPNIAAFWQIWKRRAARCRSVGKSTSG